ncbi:MAG TPA: hypothetical protein VHT96_00675 [Clostridia bacterium]|nr:hypothetical protein [Clostridia bacterium]
MLVSLGLKPFSEYWITCYYNKILSIFTSIDPSYRYAAYMNDYHYDIHDWNYNHLQLRPMIEFVEKYIQGVFTYLPIYFREEGTGLDVIKDHIRQKEIVQVGVDLFYWLPSSINFGVNHWYHTSMINGFDDEKKVFYVFDDDNFGYAEQEIPEERFLLATNNCTLKSHGDILKITGDLRPYVFSSNDVVRNAKRLIDEIGAMKMEPFWLLSEEQFNTGEMRDTIAVHIFQISKRHYANGFLFQNLLNEYCDSDIICSLVDRSKKLQKNWLIVRSKVLLVHNTKTDRSKKLSAVNEICKRLFYEEMEMWNFLIDNIKSLQKPG